MSSPDMIEWANEHPDRAAIRIAELERENAALKAKVEVIVKNYEDYKAENAALKEDKARLWDNVVFWHEAYCSVGEALGVNEPERSGRDFFAELVKELVAESAALREDKKRLDWLTNTSCWLMFPGLSTHQNWRQGTARYVIDLARKETEP